MPDSTNGMMLTIYAYQAFYQPDQLVAGGDLRYPRDSRLAPTVVAGYGAESARLRAQLERRDDDGTRWVYYTRSDGEAGRMLRYVWNVCARRLTPTEMAYQIRVACRGTRLDLQIEALA